VGGEVGGDRPAAIGWWCAGQLSRLLDGAERAVVCGDLIESGVGPRRALVEIAGLIARRQAALWLEWRPWVALATVAIPLGVLLSYISRWWADGSATLLAPYLTRLSWAHLQNPGARSDFVEFTALLLLGYAALVGWSWTCGFVLGTISPRTRGIMGALFCGCVLLGTIGTTTTARAWPGNADIFAGTFFSTLHPLLLRVVYVILPAEWGLQASRRRASLPILPAVLAAVVIAVFTAVEARGVEAALSFGAGVIPAPGPDGIVGTADDARALRFLPLVLMWPAALIAASAIRREHRRIDLAIALVLAVAAAGAVAEAQSVQAAASPERLPAFEVASVKRNRLPASACRRVTCRPWIRMHRRSSRRCRSSSD
jgi:hypothetical protein